MDVQALFNDEVAAVMLDLHSCLGHVYHTMHHSLIFDFNPYYGHVVRVLTWHHVGGVVLLHAAGRDCCQL